VNGITATAQASVGGYDFAVRGSNPCSSVTVDFGDRTANNYPIKALPTSVWHHYTRGGTYVIRATGSSADCGGEASTSINVPLPTSEPSPTPPPTPPTPPPGRAAEPPAGRAAEPPPARGAQPRTAEPQQAMRFIEMDRNRDGIITRNEWTGSAQSFQTHDWNGDGRLAGDEVRVGAVPPPARGGRSSDQFSDWTESRFRQLDTNRDGRISRAEWRFNLEDFLRLDRNRDNALTLNEFLVGDIDEDRGDRFDDLDLNRDNRIERSEWHGSLDTFRWLDRNNDGVLSRMEVSGVDQSPAGYPDNRGGDRGNNSGNNSGNNNGNNNGNGNGGRGGRQMTVAVSSQQAWTDTGITLRAGDPIMIRASGRIQFSGNGRDVAEPDGARGRAPTAAAPLPHVDIGALIGRIGNSPPFLIGSDSGDLRAPRDGPLYLGVNDDVLRDNRGEFQVTIIR
jgi:Ca2+-binding EF-hand superfamily protein